MEKVVRMQNFNGLWGCYTEIITDRNEYAMSDDHRYIYRRCSDNVRGRIIANSDGIDFVSEN